jgi:hypothetical protein
MKLTPSVNAHVGSIAFLYIGAKHINKGTVGSTLK